MASGKQFVVIGLGRFGQSVAKTLYDLGHDVLAIDIDEEAVREILNTVQQSVDRYNTFGKHTHMEYAVGYAISTAYRESNLKILLEKADKKMYQRKAAMKGDSY